MSCEFMKSMNFTINDFIKLEKLGEGTYGEVYKAKHKESNEIVAIKKIKSDNEIDGIQPTTLREIAMLKELKHPNIVNMIDTFVEKGRLYLVFEFLAYDLKKYMELQTNHFKIRKIKIFTYQMFEGVLYCHARRILHRDIKPQNILVDPEREVLKLADFGLARSFGTPIRILTHEVVTLWYRAPEILLNIERYGTGVDVWALGCIMAELVLLKPLFTGDCEIDQLFSIFRVMGTPTIEQWPELASSSAYQKTFPKWDRCIPKRLASILKEEGINLFLRVFHYNPSQRISAVDALKHPFFNLIKDDMVPAYGEEDKILTYRRKDDTNKENEAVITISSSSSSRVTRSSSKMLTENMTDNDDEHINLDDYDNDDTSGFEIGEENSPYEVELNDL